MSLKLRLATSDDATPLTEIYFSAFKDDDISLFCFPSREKDTPSFNWWYKSILEELQDPSSHFICIYDSSSPSQTIVSWAKWNDASASLPNISDLPTWPEGCDTSVANHFFGTLIERRREIMGERRHWYLEILATRPEWQGKGAAGKLMRWGLQKADEQGVETYLEASPVGKAVYEHFGFEEFSRLNVPVGGKENFVECFMLRPIRGKASKS